MKKTSRVSAHIALASGLVLLFAGCQVAPKMTQAPVDQEGNVKGNIGKGTSGSQVQNPAATGSAARDGVPADAKVVGQVVDTAGKPVAGAKIVTYHGFTATTDDQGKYSLDVASQDEIRLDVSKTGYLNRQELVGVGPGMEGNLTITLKPLDAKLTKITAAQGGTAVNSDGSAVLEVPPGALTGDSDVRLTWMDPMPSDNFPSWSGELPGNLVTKTRDNGDKSAENLALPPVAFTDVQFVQANLKPGATATLRMKVNPDALALSANQIDFNNPATLQQPCYDFDRSSGLWVNPATSKLEKDAKGDVWFVYTVRGNEAPKNFHALSHVTGQQTITWQETEAVERVVRVGGSTRVVTEYVTVTKSRVEDLKGKHYDGTVFEHSAVTGKTTGLQGATVFHARDFFGGTSKTSGAGGGFDVPMWHNSNGVAVSGASYFKANSNNVNGMNVTIETDNHVTLKLEGAWNSEKTDTVTLTYKIDGVQKSEELKVTNGNEINLDFDRGNNDRTFEIVSAENKMLQSATVAPVKNIVPGDKRTLPIPMAFKAGAIK
jgi:hypothetical protein